MTAAVASVARGFGRRGPASLQTAVRQGTLGGVRSVAESARQPLGIQGLRRGSDRRPRIYPLVTLFLTLLAPQNRTFLGELGALGMPPAQQAGAVKDRAKRFHDVEPGVGVSGAVRGLRLCPPADSTVTGRFARGGRELERRVAAGELFASATPAGAGCGGRPMRGAATGYAARTVPSNGTPNLERVGPSGVTTLILKGVFALEF